MPYPQPRERRYPPSPYAPRSAATAAYRDAFDLGKRHYAALDLGAVIRYCNGLRRLTPEWRGYVDGVRAGWELEQACLAGERQAQREAYAAQRAQWRREAQAEQPY